MSTSGSADQRGIVKRSAGASGHFGGGSRCGMGGGMSLGLQGTVGLLVALFIAAASLWATGHAVLRKRDEGATLGWVAVIWVAPGLGVLLYVILGINRIQRRALKLRRPGAELPMSRPNVGVIASESEGRPKHDPTSRPPGTEGLPGLERLLDRVCAFPRTRHNKVEPLENGDEAYPAMWRAIDEAQRSIALMTYIFDRDPSGDAFVERLKSAVRRGVEVRVLVDDAGIRYSFPTIIGVLRDAGIPHARFMPTVLWKAPYFNLRTHRKVLVVDGRLGFTGGINIRHGNRLDLDPRRPIRDLHFRVQGPVVKQLMQVFVEDWQFATKEALRGERWASEPEAAGSCLARAVIDGPDEDLDRLRWAYLGALAAAERSVRIVTPYFLPDASLVTALTVTAWRGVDVDVVLPARSNLPYMQWAMWGQLQYVVDAVRVWLTPPPFDHSKLMVVDDRWVLLGSGNWDPRSLRLNFELGVEVQDADLGERLGRWVDRRIEGARRLNRADLDARALPVKLRDGMFRLLSPYL
jgi:cardiolipin synthase